MLDGIKFSLESGFNSIIKKLTHKFIVYQKLF